ncbi:adenylate kinase-like [Hibiscus syriacus]|uniref:Adenylate kinase-like n=1 Tax=Hibiscus syriacus TaxID=106335 RepID=A0A6A2ZN61_HIBSY|nr:adenylate kinase-like [Hibiscus syriacus]
MPERDVVSWNSIISGHSKRPEALLYFEQMMKVVNEKEVPDRSENGTVCLHGRSGLIYEAFNLIVERMEFEAGPTVWGALLYACSVHGNIETGEIAGRNFFELEPDNRHNFKLLMKIYSNAGRWEDVERVRHMMLDRGL